MSAIPRCGTGKARYVFSVRWIDLASFVGFAILLFGGWRCRKGNRHTGSWWCWSSSRRWRFRGSRSGSPNSWGTCRHWRSNCRPRIGSTAPFFRRRDRLKKPESEKQRPGRKEGHEGAYRQRPEQIDEHIEVPLPCCPHCEGELSDLQQRDQYLEEIPPVRPRCFQITTWTGVCPECGPVQSTHPLQTSTAVGAAGNHLGPRVQALALLLSHRSGLTMRRTCQALQDLVRSETLARGTGPAPAAGGRSTGTRPRATHPADSPERGGVR